MGRTNWKFGESDIKVFAAFGSTNEVGAVVDLEMLKSKRGNSSSVEHIALVVKSP
ncbi:MAG: hypothetical protein ACHP6I_03330 [Rickettsiales bacterium]